MPKVYVGIGSNIDRERNIRAAVDALNSAFQNVELSPVYQTAAEGFSGTDFYNLAARFDTEDKLEDLCERLAQIESARGRVRSGLRFGPRTLDIDVLLYGDIIRHDGRFDIPRADILAYGHVLGPLVALAPDLRHPETRERLSERWKQIKDRCDLREVSLDFRAP